jgi:beta-glucosidase
MKSIVLFIALLFTGSMVAFAQAPRYAFKNPSLAVDARLHNLLSQLTIKEKVSLLGYRNKGVSRLGIPAYNWWNEALHGVARAGEATVFPQAIGMAASFDDSLLHKVASVISTEARAKHNLALARGGGGQYFGLTFWSPEINIFRDPRWGRGQETYGEDPYLTSRMAVAFIRGMQGGDSEWLKTAACAKTYLAYSGPEAMRHSFNAVIDEKDLRETYLYAFRRTVEKGKVASIMTAYNAVNGIPCSINGPLIGILIRQWHFRGYLVNDCGALNDILTGHRTMSSPVKVAAAAIKAGIDLDCGDLLQSDALKAVDQHLLTEQEIDSSLAPLLRTELRLGFFTPKDDNPWRSYGRDSIDNSYQVTVAKKMAEESMVLLKNDGVLPLKKDKYRSILVTGPSAASLDALVGSYHGLSDDMVNFVEGIVKAVDPGTGVEYDKGCVDADTSHFGGIWASTNNDITIAVIGLTPLQEGEEGDAFLSPDARGDRKNIQLPTAQIDFIKALHQASDHPIVAVVTGGSDLDLSSIAPYVNAILLAWYPGEQGGNALADILFGKVSPSGHLPVTFYHSISDLPAFTDYSMKGRTYRYFKGKVEYPFGFGLSYTSFGYAWVKEPQVVDDSIAFSVEVRNTGDYDGDAVPQVYIEYPALPGMPLKELKSLERVSLKKKEGKTVKFSIPVSELRKWDVRDDGWKLYGGTYHIFVGSNSDDERLAAKIELK